MTKEKGSDSVWEEEETSLRDLSHQPNQVSGFKSEVISHGSRAGIIDCRIVEIDSKILEEAKKILLEHGNQDPLLFIKQSLPWPFFLPIDSGWNPENLEQKISQHIRDLGTPHYAKAFLQKLDTALEYCFSLNENSMAIPEKAGKALLDSLTHLRIIYLGDLRFLLESYQRNDMDLIARLCLWTKKNRSAVSLLRVLEEFQPHFGDLTANMGIYRKMPDIVPIVDEFFAEGKGLERSRKILWNLFSLLQTRSTEVELNEKFVVEINNRQPSFLLQIADQRTVFNIFCDKINKNETGEITHDKALSKSLHDLLGAKKYDLLCEDCRKMSNNDFSNLNDPLGIGEKNLQIFWAEVKDPANYISVHERLAPEILAIRRNNFRLLGMKQEKIRKVQSIASSATKEQFALQELKEMQFDLCLDLGVITPGDSDFFMALDWFYFLKPQNQKIYLQRHLSYMMERDPEGISLSRAFLGLQRKPPLLKCFLQILSEDDRVTDYLLGIKAKNQNLLGATALNLLGMAHFGSFNAAKVQKILQALFAKNEDFSSLDKADDLFILLSYCSKAEHHKTVLAFLLENRFLWEDVLKHNLSHSGQTEHCVNYFTKNKPVLALLKNHLDEIQQDKFRFRNATVFTEDVLHKASSTFSTPEKSYEEMSLKISAESDWPLLKEFGLKLNGPINDYWEFQVLISPLPPLKKGDKIDLQWKMEVEIFTLSDTRGIVKEKFAAYGGTDHLHPITKCSLKPETLRLLKNIGIELVYGYMVREKMEASRLQAAVDPVNISHVSPAEPTDESASANETGGAESAGDLNPESVPPSDSPQSFAPKNQQASRIDMRHRPKDAGLVERQKREVRGILNRNLDLLGALRAEQTPEEIERANECQGPLHEELIVYRRVHASDNNIGRFERLSAGEVKQKIDEGSLFAPEENLYAMTSEYYRKLAGVRWRQEKRICSINANKATITAQRAHQEHLRSGMPSVGALAERKSIDLKLLLDLEGGLAIKNAAAPESWPAALGAATKMAAMNAVTISQREIGDEEYQNDPSIRALAGKKTWDWLESNLSALRRDLAEIARELQELESLTTLEFQQKRIRSCQNSENDMFANIDRLEKKGDSLEKSIAANIDPELLAQRNMIAAQVESVTDHYLEKSESVKTLQDILDLAEEGDEKALSKIEKKRNEKIADLLAEQALKNQELADFATEQRRVASFNRVEIKIDPETGESRGHLRLGLVGKNMGNETFNQGEFQSLAELFGKK